MKQRFQKIIATYKQWIQQADRKTLLGIEITLFCISLLIGILIPESIKKIIFGVTLFIFISSIIYQIQKRKNQTKE